MRHARKDVATMIAIRAIQATFQCPVSPPQGGGSVEKYMGPSRFQCWSRRKRHPGRSPYLYVHTHSMHAPTLGAGAGPSLTTPSTGMDNRILASPTSSSPLRSSLFVAVEMAAGGYGL